MIVQVINGPIIKNIPWTKGMNAQKAMEFAHDLQDPNNQFTYLLQYYGSLGYLVTMINETYETFPSPCPPTTTPPPAPYYYWEFLVNDVPSQTGIDNTILNPGDIISFELQTYDQARHASSTVRTKHMRRLRQAIK